MKVKRWLPALLVLILLVGCMTYTVFAASEDTTPVAHRVDYMPDPRQPDTYEPSVFFGDGSEIPEPSVYHTTVEDAAADLRSHLENREAVIGIGFQTASGDFDKRLEVFNKALEHTGVPTQGDYLAYQHGAYRYGYSYYVQGGIYYVTLSYEMTYYTTAQQEAQVDAAVDALLDELDVYDAGDYEKIRAVYDYMCANITYDYDGLEIYKQDNSYKKIYTAYAALIDGTAVCQGYANLFYRLVLELGVDSRIISGLGNGGGHAWNIVELDNLYYDVDATWDATRKQADQVYEFFLRCDANFGDHTRDAEFTTEEFNAAYPMSDADYYYLIDSGMIGANIAWTLGSDYQLNVSGNGAITERPWENYYYVIESIMISPGITDIGKQGFLSFYELHTITIPASVTNVDWAAFYACNNLQTVIYGGTKEKWDQITVSDYNENLTSATILYTGEIKLSGAAPTLYDNIAMNYKVNKTKFDSFGITDPYVVVTFNGVETTITDYTVSQDGTQYIFPFYNIAPNQMNDTLTAVLYATYGGNVYAGKPKDYSVAEYCYNQLSKCSDDAYAEFRTLLVDLLNYGAVSQQFTKYNTEKLVNADLTPAQKNWGTNASRNYTNIQTTKYTVIDNPTVSWKGGGLLLNDSIVMRFKFETDSLDGLSFKVESDNNTWTINNISVENGTNYIYFRGLNAAQMSNEVRLTAYRNGVPVSNTVLYSIESYAAQKVKDTTTDYLAELVDAMMKYGDSAKAFITP